MINPENIEIYILDFYEGNLSEAQVAELMQFLNQYPEWKQVFDAFELIELNDSDSQKLDESFRNKLKKEEGPSHYISDARIQELLIGELEETLSQQDQEKLIYVLASDKSVQRQKELYKKTVLTPDFSVVYPHKQQLKKGRKPLYQLNVFRYTAVAATFLLLMISYSIFKNETVPFVPVAVNIPVSKNAEINIVSVEREENKTIISAVNNRERLFSMVNHSGLKEVIEGHIGSELVESALKYSGLIYAKEVRSLSPKPSENVYIRNTPPMSSDEKMALRKYLVKQEQPVSQNFNQVQAEMGEPELSDNTESTEILAFNQPPMLVQIKPKTIGEIVIERINTDAGLDIIDEGSRKFNLRNALIAFSRYIKDQKAFLRHTDKESSEEIAIRFGNIEIAQAFSK